MKLYGLTGGIATGKSTVTALLREAGLHVIDADALAREAVLPGTPALAEIAARFEGVVENGVLNRSKLGALVFNDGEARAALNAIVHPRVRELAAQKTAALEAQGIDLAIYDAALLIENRLHEGMNGVILVTTPLDVQLRRLMARDGIDEAAARARIASQLPQAEKEKHATWLIDNGGTREETLRQVEALVLTLTSMNTRSRPIR